MPDSVPEVEITGGMIRLGQLLKYASLADTGADAKDLLAQEQVRVNGEIEIRRGRQLVPGDTVTVGVGQHAETVRLV